MPAGGAPRRGLSEACNPHLGTAQGLAQSDLDTLGALAECGLTGRLSWGAAV